MSKQQPRSRERPEKPVLLKWPIAVVPETNTKALVVCDQ
jgi:hypothetical protein